MPPIFFNCSLPRRRPSSAYSKHRRTASLVYCSLGYSSLSSPETVCLTAIVSRWFRSRPSLKYLLIVAEGPLSHLAHPFGQIVHDKTVQVLRMTVELSGQLAGDDKIRSLISAVAGFGTPAQTISDLQ